MATYPRCRVAEGQLTAAQVNANSRAGTVIVDAVAGKTITVVDGWLRAIGGAASGPTAVHVEDTAGTDAFTMAVAGMSQNAVCRVGLATHSTNTNVGTALGKGKGLRIGCTTAADYATATHLDYVVMYKVDSD